jgi:hypothetical protein
MVGLCVQTRVCRRVLGLTLKSKQPKAKVFPHTGAWVRVGRGIPHSEGLYKFITRYAIP